MTEKEIRLLKKLSSPKSMRAWIHGLALISGALREEAIDKMTLRMKEHKAPADLTAFASKLKDEAFYKKVIQALEGLYDDYAFIKTNRIKKN